MAGPTISGITAINGTSIPQYGIFEVGFNLSVSYNTVTGVYDSAVIRCFATFYEASTGNQYGTREAFWFEDQSVSGTTTELYTTTGTPQFRVRYMPLAVGRSGLITYDLTAVSPAGTTTNVAAGTFTMTAPTAGVHGPVTVVNGTNFAYADGTPYIPIGKDIGIDDRGDRDGTAYYQAILNPMGSSGGNWTRFWQFAYNRTAMEWDSGATLRKSPNKYQGFGHFAPSAAKRVDILMNTASANKIVVQMVLMPHGEWSSYNNPSWSVNGTFTDPNDGHNDTNSHGPNPYNSLAVKPGPVNNLHPENYLTDATVRAGLKKRFRYVVARWGAYWNLIWELANEQTSTGSHAIDGFSTDSTFRANLLTFLLDISPYIRSQDNNQHLITWSQDWEHVSNNLTLLTSTSTRNTTDWVWVGGGNPQPTATFAGDPTGVTDQASALNTFLAANKGGVIQIPFGTYRILSEVNPGQNWWGTILWNGAILKPEYNSGNKFYPLRLQGCGGSAAQPMVNYDFAADGSNVTTPATTAAITNGANSREQEHAVAIYGGDHIALIRSSTKKFWGDGFWLTRWTTGGSFDGSSPTTIVIDGHTSDQHGRNSISVISGVNVWYVNPTSSNIGFDVVDVEPNSSADTVGSIYVDGGSGSIGTYDLGNNNQGFNWGHGLAFHGAGTNGSGTATLLDVRRLKGNHVDLSFRNATSIVTDGNSATISSTAPISNVTNVTWGTNTNITPSPGQSVVTPSAQPAPVEPAATAPITDYSTIHAYQVDDVTPAPGRNASAFADAIDLAGRTGKPVIVAETGLSPAGLEASYNTTSGSFTTAQHGHLKEGTHVHNQLWAGTMSGGVGGMHWWQGSYIEDDPANGRTSGTQSGIAWSFPLDNVVFPALSAFLAGETFALTPTPAKISLSTATTLVGYGWGNVNRALLWVRDALNTYSSGVLPGDMAARTIATPTLTVSALSATHQYTVETWSTYGAGGLVSTQILQSNSSGVLSIPVATITRDAAYKVYASVPSTPSFANDQFSRTVSSGWGSADLGGAYTLSGTAADFNVGSGYGTMNLPSSGSTRAAGLLAVSGQDFDESFQFKISAYPTSVGMSVYLGLRNDSISNNYYRASINLATNSTASLALNTVLATVATQIGPSFNLGTYAINTLYWIRFQAVGISPTTLRVKFWADGTTEPGWQIVTTDTAAILQNPGGVSLRAFAGTGQTTANILVSFNQLIVGAPAPLSTHKFFRRVALMSR